MNEPNPAEDATAKAGVTEEQVIAYFQQQRSRIQTLLKDDYVVVKLELDGSTGDAKWHTYVPKTSWQEGKTLSEAVAAHNSKAALEMAAAEKRAAAAALLAEAESLEQSAK